MSETKLLSPDEHHRVTQESGKRSSVTDGNHIGKRNKKRTSGGDTTMVYSVTEAADIALDNTDSMTEMYSFYDNIDVMERTMKRILQTKLAQETKAVQTESTSITAQEVECQTLDDEILALGPTGNDTEKFVLPDLEECINNLRIDMETQTDLKMRNMTGDGQFIDHDNVIIIYRNPRLMTTILLPYLASAVGISLLAFGCFRGFRYISAVRASA